MSRTTHRSRGSAAAALLVLFVLCAVPALSAQAQDPSELLTLRIDRLLSSEATPVRPPSVSLGTAKELPDTSPKASAVAAPLPGPGESPLRSRASKGYAGSRMRCVHGPRVEQGGRSRVAPLASTELPR